MTDKDTARPVLSGLGNKLLHRCAGLDNRQTVQIECRGVIVAGSSEFANLAILHAGAPETYHRKRLNRSQYMCSTRQVQGSGRTQFTFRAISCALVVCAHCDRVTRNPGMRPGAVHRQGHYRPDGIAKQFTVFIAIHG